MVNMHKPTFALLVTIFLWSSGFVAIRIGLQGYEPGSLALLRYLITSVGIFFPFILLSKRTKLSFKEFVQCTVVGMVGFGVYNITLNYGETTVDAGVASFINSQIPITVLILALLFLCEKVSLSVLTGITLSCLGVSLIAYGYSENPEWKLGIIYLLIANVCAAVYTVCCKPLLKKYHPLELTAYTTWGGTILLLIYSPVLWRQIAIAPSNATMAAIYLGVFPGLVGYLAWNYALRYLPAVHASSYLYAMPLVATVMGWLCMGELPTFITLLGGMIALIGALQRYSKDNKLADEA